MRLMGANTRRESGAVLLVAIAILGLLSLFAVAFASLVRLERRASQNYTDAVRARLAARAGIQRAISELREYAGKRPYSDRTWYASNGSVLNAKADAWGYTYSKPATPLLSTERPDLGTTLTPSFRLDPLPADLAGKLVCSGIMGRSYAGGADAFKLKVLDSASQINLNHPDGPSIRRMLRNLLKNVQLTDVGTYFTLAALNDTAVNGVVDLVVSKRPPAGFNSKGDIYELVKPELAKNVGDAKADDYWLALRDCVTVHSWVDEKVIRPFALNVDEGEMPRRALNMMGRAPVNLNTAPVAVLIAVLADVKARTSWGEFSISPAAAKEIANAIDARRRPVAGSASEFHGPFRSWEEFDLWLDGDNGLGWGTWAGMPAHQTYDKKDPKKPVLTSLNADAPCAIANSRGQFLRDLVKAVLNPNSDVNKFGNDANLSGSAPIHPGSYTLPRLIDKADLVAHTTEGCFDSMGVYEITSLGRIYDKAFTTLAEQTLQQIVRVYSVFRLTTQQDFELSRGYALPGNFHPEKPQPDPEFSGMNLFQLPKLPASTPGLDPEINNLRNGNPGYPGVTTYPQYSLRREGSPNRWRIKDEYDAATWDGQLSLTNLIYVRPGHEDFICGFANGSLDAYKTRGYWDPRDECNEPFTDTTADVNKGQDPGPNCHIDKNRATHPAPVKFAVGGKNVGDGGQELLRMAQPLNGSDRAPRIKTEYKTSPDSPEPSSVLNNVIDPATVPGPLGGTDAAAAYGPARDMFVEGSALLNGGAAVSPDRTHKPQLIERLVPGTSDKVEKVQCHDGGDRPRFLVYSGDNLDLVNETSIRFWVMPLEDPYALPEETLFSWVGEEYEPNRKSSPYHRVGFEVVKQVSGSHVVLKLKVYDFAEEGEADAVVQVGPKDVTFARDGWNPGTWHHVIVECGVDQGASGAATIRLEVDGRPADQKIFFRGSGKAGVGRVHGHIQQGGDYYPFSDPAIPNRRGVFVTWQTRLLGNYLHCHRTGKGTKKTNKSVTVTDAWVYDAGTKTYKPSHEGPFDGPRTWASAPFVDGVDLDQSIQLRFTAKPGQDASKLPGQNPARMRQDPQSGEWTYNMKAADTGPDGVPGGEEWQIDAIISWMNLSDSGGKDVCPCCTGSPSPWMVPSHGAGAADPHCHHDSKQTYKSGWKFTTVNGGPCKGFQFEGTPTLGGALPGVVPVHYCDDCHGCDGCKIRAPIYLGGRPARDEGKGNGAYEAGSYQDKQHPKTIPDIDASTCAAVVFDNILFINASKEKRVDHPNYPPDQKIQDRYFEFALKRGVEQTLGAYDPKTHTYDPSRSVVRDDFKGSTDESGIQFGAHYERILPELLGREGYLGTLTWTAYPTRRREVNPTTGALEWIGEKGLQFEVSLHHIDVDAFANDADAFMRQWNSWLGSATGVPPLSPLLEGNRYPDVKTGRAPITMGDVIDGTVADGYGFGRKLLVTGAGTASSGELLVLSVRLRDANSIQASEKGAAVPSDPAMKRPLRESPLLDDLTLTIVLRTTDVLYAEEGVEN